MAYKTNIRIVPKNVNKEKVGTLFLEIVFLHDSSRQKIRRYVSTNQKINTEDFVKGKIKQVDRTKSIRQIIDRKKVELSEYLRKLELEHGEISPEIYDASNKKSPYAGLSLVQLMDVFIANRSGMSEDRTIKKYKTLKFLLDEFTLKQKRKALYPHNVNKAFYDDFTRFLTVDKNHAVSTVGKYQAVLKTALRFIVDDLKIDNKIAFKEFKKVSTKKNAASRIVLLKEHVQKLIKWKPNIKRYEIVKDLFLFQIFTGIRYSDLIRVNKSFLVNGTLSFTMYKTEDSVSVPLHSLALKILKKYKYDLGKQCKSGQKYNEDIRTICEKAGLSDPFSKLKMKLNQKVDDETPLYELVSSHVARATFITNALISGISPFIVMKYSGHKEIQTLALYMRLAGDVDKDAFKKFERYFMFKNDRI